MGLMKSEHCSGFKNMYKLLDAPLPILDQSQLPITNILSVLGYTDIPDILEVRYCHCTSGHAGLVCTFLCLCLLYKCKTNR